MPMNMNPIRIRRATPADTETLGVVHVQAWREAYPGMIPDEILARLDPVQRTAMWRDGLAKGAAIQLAEQDGAIIGFGASSKQRDASLPYAGEIGAVYVLQRAQRTGVGRSLMAAMARDLIAQGYASAALWVLEANTPARRFYERLGGKVVVRRDQQRDGFRAIGIAYGWDDLHPLTRIG